MIRTAPVASRAILSENTPPSVVKGLKRARNTSGVGTRRRHLGMLSNRTPQYLADQAKKKNVMREKSLDKQAMQAAFQPSTSKATTTTSRTSERNRSNEVLTFGLARVKVEGQDVQMMDRKEDSQKATLPRTLGRPAYQEITNEALLAIVDPERPVPHPQYLREKLEVISPELWKAVISCKPEYPRNQLPAELPVNVPSPDLIPPTHVLAVQPLRAPAPGKTKSVKLYPAHSLVLGAHCTKLAPFTPAPPQQTSVTNNQVVIPTCTVTLPAPDHFPPVLTYLYTKQTAPLLRALLPFGCAPPPADVADPAARAAFAANLGRKLTAEALMDQVLIIHAVWANVCALGIFDEGLWEVLDVAWELVLTAMCVAVGQPQLMLASCSAASNEEASSTSGSAQMAPSPPRPVADPSVVWHAHCAQAVPVV